jgi:hypothetical protein
MKAFLAAYYLNQGLVGIEMDSLPPDIIAANDYDHCTNTQTVEQGMQRLFDNSTAS